MEANPARDLPRSGRSQSVAPTLDEANRCLRDIIAISTLPAVWLGAKPLRIAESLLAALDTTIAPALGYIRFHPDESEPPIEIAHLNRALAAPDVLAKLGAELTAWSALHDPEEILLIRPHPGANPLRVCVYPLGINTTSGIIAAGFVEANAPSAYQRTLLNIAANQAMVARKNAALQRKQEMLYQQAAREISDRKQAEAALRESETRFRAAFENAAMGIALVSLEGQILRGNQALTAITGYSTAELVGRNFAEIAIADNETQAAARDLIAGAIATHSAESQYRRKNGTLVWVHVTVSLLRDAAGMPHSFVTMVENIDERKKKEATLAFLVDLNAAAQRLTEPAELMSLTAERLGRHLDVDRCAYAEVEGEAIFCITGDYLRGVPSIVGRWPVAAFGSECTRSMLANESYVVVDTDSDPRIGAHDLPAYRATHIRAVICVPLHKEGRFIAAMAVHQKQPRVWSREEIELVELVVSRCWESLERARALRSLRESEQRLRFMAEAMPQKIFTATPQGDVDYLNRQWLEFSGLALHEIAGWRWLELLHPDDRDATARRWRQSIATGDSFEMENRFRRHDGVYRWHLSRAHAMRDAAGRIAMWIGSNTDITDIVQARETVAERRQELERLVKERTARLQEAVEQMEEFSYSVSHDLRAPLRSMSGYARALLDDYAEKLDDDGREYLRRIERASTRMDLLTQDVLTYSKISRMAVELEPVALEPLITELAEQQEQDSPHAEFEVIRPLPAVIGNEPMLTQVVSNLLGNAVKFVAAGVCPKVRVHAELKSERVRLWVEDNGIGIAPEYHSRIWGVFERVHPKEAFAGTGIGLAIVRKAVEKMGGAVGVESDGVHGSRFWVELAAAPANAAAAQARTGRRARVIVFPGANGDAQPLRAR